MKAGAPSANSVQMYTTRCDNGQPTFKTRASMSLEEASEGVQDRFTRAVSRRMVADVPVGTYLSGGIDSTLVCGVMSQLSTKIRSFNVGFENTPYDESKLARRIADHYGAEFETVDCTSEKLADCFEQTVRHIEQPIMNPNSIAKVILSKLVRDRGYKVCLTGEGSDEIFGGYPYFKQELLWDMANSELPQNRQLAESLLKKFYQLERRSEGFHWSRDIKGQGSLPAYLKQPNFYYCRMRASRTFINKIFTSRFQETASVRSPLEYFEKTFDTAALQPLQSFNATRLMTYQTLSQYIFPCVGDRVDMANSVECRLPFLDPELVEFVSQIPPEHFMNIRELKEKNLLRLGFRDLLPRFMDAEHKHPFMSPIPTHISCRETLRLSCSQRRQTVGIASLVDAMNSIHGMSHALASVATPVVLYFPDLLALAAVLRLHCRCRPDRTCDLAG